MSEVQDPNSLLHPVQFHKYTSMQHEVKNLRQALKDAREQIADLEHQLYLSKPSVKQDDSLEDKLLALLGKHYGDYTRTERHILKLLLKKAPMMVRHAEMMNWIYAGVIDIPQDKIKDVFISKVRHKLRLYKTLCEIVTVWGEGWKLNLGVEQGHTYMISKSQLAAPCVSNSLSEIEPQIYFTGGKRIFKSDE